MKNSKIAWTDQEKKLARSKVNVAIRFGKMKDPNDLPCVDCGHIYAPGERRHEYDHHAGYDKENFLNVEAVCTLCHSKRDCTKTNQTHCIHGHEFTPENTEIRSNGTRACRACDNLKKKKTRTAEWWRNYRLSKRTA